MSKETKGWPKQGYRYKGRRYMTWGPSRGTKKAMNGDWYNVDRFIIMCGQMEARFVVDAMLMDMDRRNNPSLEYIRGHVMMMHEELEKKAHGSTMHVPRG